MARANSCVTCHVSGSIRFYLTILELLSFHYLIRANRFFGLISMRLSTLHSRFLAAAVPLFQFVSVEAACYYPNGDLNPDDVPCNASADASVCCGRGWTCLSNGVCMLGQDSSVGSISRIGSTYRTSCTDRSWNSTACPNFCSGVYLLLGTCPHVSYFTIVAD